MTDFFDDPTFATCPNPEADHPGFPCAHPVPDEAPIITFEEEPAHRGWIGEPMPKTTTIRFDGIAVASIIHLEGGKFNAATLRTLHPSANFDDLHDAVAWAIQAAGEE